jgi:outer membrane protein
MKHHRLYLLIVALVAAGTSAARADLKLGAVDMNQVFTDYYKTKDAQAKYTDAEKSANDDLENRVATLKKSMLEINQLNADLQKQGLSKDAMDAKRRELQPKIEAARALDREIADFRSAKQKALQDQFLRMRKDIVDDITKTVSELSKERGFDLVVDKSGLSAGAVPVVLFSNPSFDFTKDVLDLLNKTAPAGKTSR